MNDLQVEVVDNPTEMAPLELIERATVDMQIATAKKYPRSITKFMQEVETMISEDPDLAEACIYALPRAGKTIKGKSVRLAEIAMSAWGNMKAGARIVANDGKNVTAQGVCIDLEKNVSFSIEKKRRITDKFGKTYNDDMQTVTANAAAAVAFRDAVFKIIPQAYLKRIEQVAVQVALGDIKALPERRDKALSHFQKLGIKPERIYLSLGVKGKDDLTKDNIEYLLGVSNAIHAGEANVDDAFPIPENIDPKTGEVLGKADTVLNKAKKNLGKDEPTASEGFEPPTPEEVKRAEKEDYKKPLGAK